jgi:hypothetical protein
MCWNKKKKNVCVWEDDEEHKNATLPTQLFRIVSLHVIQVAALSINACAGAFRYLNCLFAPDIYAAGDVAVF